MPTPRKPPADPASAPSDTATGNDPVSGRPTRPPGYAEPQPRDRGQAQQSPRGRKPNPEEGGLEGDPSDRSDPSADH